MKRLYNTWLAILFATIAYCQSPPTSLNDSSLKTVRSPGDGRISITYKSPDAGTCTTVFSTQQQYTGYVTIPPFALAPLQGNYTLNTFFWFIESRTSPSNAPLTIYINGGPGSSSMVGLFEETGPCQVVEVAKGQFGTLARDWGWDRSSNMLYIDQPNLVGFSFDQAVNGSLNLFTGAVSDPPSAAPPAVPPTAFLNGTFSSTIQNNTANTTAIAANSIWHMLQAFLSEFPQYDPNIGSNGTRSAFGGINLFAESYGGKYGPAFGIFWEQQNALRSNGSLSENKTVDLHLNAIGIIQGCVDDLVQGSFFPVFANNNTYGIKALSVVDEEAAATSYLSATGCQQLIQQCRNAVQSSDPESYGNVSSVNKACISANSNCQQNVIDPFLSSGLNPYDITQKQYSPFPPSTYLEYLNNADVQSAIGAIVNYTQSNSVVSAAFSSTGDAERGDPIGQLAYLLSSGVRVALIYGDRDYACNWLGGEAVSFSIAARAPAYAPFYNAGYADLVVNSTYVGGAVRQYGNLSFSRIYGAGHLVPAYQPETAFTLFTRIIQGDDLSLGNPVDLSSYQTNGTANATFTAKPPSQPSPTCWIRDIQNKCNDQQKLKLQQGQGIIINGVLYDDESQWITPDPSVASAAGWPGHPPSSTVATAGPPLLVTTVKGGSTTVSSKAVPTGVFTATATPSPSKSAAMSRFPNDSTFPITGVRAVAISVVTIILLNCILS